MSETQQPIFHIQKIYTKDISFESPATPQSFELQGQPKMDVDLGVESRKVEGYDGLFEVVVRVTVEVTYEEKAVFLVEVKQGGLFVLRNFPAEQVRHVVGVHCPNILFPYLREVVSDLVIRGGFPPLLLDPVDFEALYRHNVQQEGNA